MSASAPGPVQLNTMTYEVTGRVARITFDRPDKGNAIIADTPVELAACVERADLDPQVHVILVSGRGAGFCAAAPVDRSSTWCTRTTAGSCGSSTTRTRSTRCHPSASSAPRTSRC